MTPLAILICLILYLPFAWILFLNENRGAWMKVWLMLPGGIPAYLLRLDSGIGILISLLLPFAMLFVMLRFPKRQIPISAVALAFSCIVSFFAYLQYLE
jgi:hypothetical protein